MRAPLLLICFVLTACTPPPEMVGEGRDAEEQAKLAREIAEIDACGYAGCSGPHHSADHVEFGALPMGAPVRAIPEGATESLGDCVGRPFLEDGPVGLCSFVIDGVVHVVNGGKVVLKSIDFAAPPTSGLPFGLRGDEAPDEALATVRSATGLPMTLSELPGEIADIRNDDVLRNALGANFVLGIAFTPDGRLAVIALQDVAAPAD